DQYTIGSLGFRGAAGIVDIDNAVLPDKVDGIMGLWYYAQGSVVPILNVLKNTTALDQNLIGIYLLPSSTEASTPGGEITFGGVNTDRFTGSVTYVNCVPGRPWTIPLSAVSVNGNSIPTVINKPLATIDTGTTAMLMPKAAADAINSAIPGSVRAPNADNLWFLPCEGNTPVTFTFGDFAATVPYKDMAMQSTAQRTSQGMYCQSAAMFPTGSVTSIDEWLIGDSLLKNVYSVFDFGANAQNGGRIGFANLGSGGSAGDTDSAGTPGLTIPGKTNIMASAILVSLVAMAGLL
ncbi:hypothetical protein BG004_002981, partial [Podila humilis]